MVKKPNIVFLLYFMQKELEHLKDKEGKLIEQMDMLIMEKQKKGQEEL